MKRQVLKIIFCLFLAIVAALRANSQTISFQGYSGITNSPYLLQNGTNYVVLGFSMTISGVTNYPTYSMHVPSFYIAETTTGGSISTDDISSSTLYSVPNLSTNPITGGTSLNTTNSSGPILFNTNSSYNNGTYYFYVVVNVGIIQNTPPNSVIFSISTSFPQSPYYATGSNTNVTPTVTNNSSPTTYYFGRYFDWGGGTSISWTTGSNWINSQSGNPSSTPPGSSDVARVGYIAYKANNQPTVNAASTVGEVIVGQYNSTGGVAGPSAGPTLTLSYSLTINSGLIINNSSYLTATGAGGLSISGSSTMGSSSTFILTNSLALTNNGSLTMGSGATCSITNSSSFSNIGTLTMSGSTLNINTIGSLTNSSTGIITTGNSSTINCNATLTNTGGGVITIGSSGSVTILNMGGTSGYLPNSGIVTVGPTSVINFLTSTAKIANASSFTLLSDATGSATVGTMTGTSMTGSNYRVQRYITGTTGSSGTAYQGYRLLSCPVNTNSATSGSTNYIPFNNLYGNETVSGATYYGVATGGPGGPLTGGYGFFLSNGNPTMYLWDEALNPVSGTQNKSFTSGNNVGVSANTSSGLSLSSTLTTFSTTNVPVGNGYIFYFIGSTNGPNKSGFTGGALDNATLTNIGYINQGNVPVYLWYTPAGGSSGELSYSTTKSITAYQGLNMIGNPYPSTIDLNLVYNDNSAAFKIGATQHLPVFYELVDKSQTSSLNYVSYIPANGSAGGAGSTSSTYSSEYVASGQGFFVTAIQTGKTFTFQEGEKVYNTALLTETSSPPIVLARRQGGATDFSETSNAISSVTRAIITPGNALVGLHLRLANSNGVFDECGIYFGSNGSDRFDNSDAADINPTSATAYISSLTSDGVAVGINSQSNYTKGKRIKLYVSANAGGLFSLNLEDIANIDTSAFNIYLVDNKQRDSIDIVRYKTYNFNISTSDTTTFGANRFVLAVEGKPLPPYELVSFTGQKQNTSILIDWKTYNEGDYTTFGLQKLDAYNTQYTTIYTVQGNGSGYYSYTDPNPIAGANTYRLAQNGIDSLTTFSNPLYVLYSGSSPTAVLTVYPNPATDVINLNFNNATANNTTYQANIYNAMGQLVMQASVNGNSWTQDVSTLKPGAYVIQVRASNGASVANSKFIKRQ